MKVLVLGWEYPPAVAGGLGAACHGLTCALAAQGHRVLLALPETCRSFSADLVDVDGVERIYIPVSRPGGGDPAASETLAFHPYASDVPAVAGPGQGGASNNFGAQATLYGPDLVSSVRRFAGAAVRELSGLEFDVVHAHDWMTFPAAIQLRLHAQRPICLHVHSTALDRDGAQLGAGPLGLERGTIAGVERAGVRTADAVCAVSEYTRGVLVERFGARAEETHVVHNALLGAPLDGGGSSPGHPPSPGAVDQGPEVLFLGRLTTQKGAGFLLRAASRVLKDRPDVRFVVAGAGHERSSLIEMAAGLGIARNVTFAGAIDEATKAALYRQADLFVLPSISEPFGLTPLEALAHGTAVLLSSRAGVCEVLPSAPTVDPWDTDAMAAEILRILAGPGGPTGLRSSLVSAGRADLAKLSWDRSAETLVQVLRSILPAARSVS